MTEIDFTRLHETGETFSEANTTRAVRERAVRLLQDVLDHRAVAVYGPESGRLVARARSPSFEDLGVPTAVDPRESPLGEQLSLGTPTHGRAPQAFGDAASWCVAPVGDGGGLVAVAETPEAFDADVTAAVSGVSLHVESALEEVSSPAASFRPDEYEDGVPDDVLLDALRYSYPDYAFLYDADGTYLDVLLGARNLSLNSREELLGRTVTEVFDDPETAARIVDGIRAALSEWTTQRLEYPVQTPDGTRHYEAQISPLPRDRGGRDAAVMVARDVTERRERERELERKNERLAEFAGVVSHDLRNPLEAATGFLEVARDRADGETEALDRVESSLDRMERIVSDLLSLAREGEAVSDPEPVDAEASARAAWTPLETEAASLSVEPLPTVVADRDGLRRLFENLFRNALEHAGRDVTVTVDVRDAASPGVDTVAGADAVARTGLYVADDGPGVSPSERDGVFETGYTTSRDGTGFGLSIVRRIARAHGWTVTLTESADGGARFEFRGVEPADDGDGGDEGDTDQTV